MSGRNVLRSSTHSVTIIFLMLGILFFINVISSRIFFREDLTENKEYTVSESTRKVLGELDDIINITAYFSKDLPPRYKLIRTQSEDILAEYEAYSDGNLNIEFIDPGTDEDLKARLGRMGVPELPLQDATRDKAVISMGYLGIAVQYGDNSKIIPFIDETMVRNLEYEITSALLAVKDPEPEIIIWVGDTPADPRQDPRQDPQGIKMLHDELNKSFVVRPMAPGKLSVIPTRTSLVIVDGSVELPERALYAIDQYIMHDGNAIFLTDKVALQEGQGMSAAVTDQSIHPLLEHYGVRIEDKLVADVQSPMVPFNVANRRRLIQYSLWPMIVGDGFNAEIPAVNRLESLILPWTSPLVLDIPDSESIEAEPLLRSSKGSWVIDPPFDIDPIKNSEVPKDNLQRSVLAYDLQGQFTSYFKDRPIPEDPASPGGMDETEEEEVDTASNNSRIVVVASTRFVKNAYLSRNNLLFIHNIIDSLTIGNTLISIRSRGQTYRPLNFGTNDEEKMESIKRFHWFIGTFMVPIAVIVFGLVRTMMRRRSKNQLQQVSQGGE